MIRNSGGVWRLFLVPMALICLFMALGSCTRMPPPSNVDHGSSGFEEEGKSLVLGRVRIIDNYRESPFRPWKRVPYPWQQKGWKIGVGNIAGIGYLDQFVFRIDGDHGEGGELETLTFAPHEDGTFVWSLFPGNYSIAGCIGAIGSLRYRFDLPNGGPRFTVPTDTLVYIGTLTFLMPEGTQADNGGILEAVRASNIFIEDDRARALERLSELLPGVARTPVTRLMTGFPLIPADSLLGDSKPPKRKRTSGIRQ